MATRRTSDAPNPSASGRSHPSGSTYCVATRTRVHATRERSTPAIHSFLAAPASLAMTFFPRELSQPVFPTLSVSVLLA